MILSCWIFWIQQGRRNTEVRGGAGPARRRHSKEHDTDDISFHTFLHTALRDEYMRSADGFLVVFDITNRKTYNELSEFRKQIQRAKDNPRPSIVIVGNKSDLPETERAVTSQEAGALCKEWQVPYVEASAKIRKNVDERFVTVPVVARLLACRGCSLTPNTHTQLRRSS
jgi:GTPase SAR1 family protein